MTHRILIVDDDEQLARSYKEYFTTLGYEVDCALELEEAQALLGHFSYSVVITDLRLSRLGFGGLDLVKHIRELSLQTHVLVLTGYFWPELKSEAMSHRVDAFVRKPTRMAELAQTVSSLTGGAA
jgi:DNA-binding response OmpR family regulator